MIIWSSSCGQRGADRGPYDPKSKAPEIADRLVRAGIKAIWNFAHTDLNVPDDVVVENVHLSESLMRLSYRVCSMQDERERKEREKTV